MAQDGTQWPSHEEITRFIRHRVRRLVRLKAYRNTDPRDIEQNLWCQVLRAQPQHDLNRGQVNTFLDRILRNRMVQMIEYAAAAKRQGDQVSWEGPSIEGDPDSDPISEAYSAEEYYERTGFGARPSAHTHDVAIDLAVPLEALPSALRELALRLKFQSPAEAGRAMRLSQATLYRRIEKLRKHFEHLDLGVYLGRKTIPGPRPKKLKKTGQVSRRSGK